MLGVLPGPTATWAGSSVGSRCPATFDFRCLALFPGYPGLAMDLVQKMYGNRSDGCPAADCDCACHFREAEGTGPTSAAGEALGGYGGEGARGGVGSSLYCGFQGGND